MPHTLFIIVNNGIVVKHGQIFSLGSCLAVDFILESEQLIDKSVGTALTFVQVETLHHKTLFKVLEGFPIDLSVVRRAKIRLALMRKVVELAQIELTHRKEDGEDLKDFRRWSMHTNTTTGQETGIVRSLSTKETKKVVTKEGIMYELTPRSLSVREETPVAAHSPQYQGRVNHNSMKETDLQAKQGVRKGFFDGLSTERQSAKLSHLPIESPNGRSPSGRSPSAGYSSGFHSGRERSLSCERELREKNNAVLKDIKTSVFTYVCFQISVLAYHPLHPFHITHVCSVLIGEFYGREDKSYRECHGESDTRIGLAHFVTRAQQERR